VTATTVIGVSAGVALASTPGPATAGAAAGAARPDMTSVRPGTAASGDPQPGPSGTGTSARTKPQPHQPPAHRSSYLIYDSVLPSAVPSNRVLASYATGPFAVTAAQVAGHKAVLWIDVTGLDPAAAAVDVEPGDVTPDVAATWVRRKLTADRGALAIIYTSRAEWPLAQAAVDTLPAWMGARVRWWIADPTGYPHVLPGSSATQWYWGSSYDISTALPGF
jgi:hypothetical protein